MKKLSMNAFLGGDLNKVSKQKDLDKEVVKYLSKYFREGYKKSVDEDYLVTPKEKNLLYRLVVEYGKDKIQQTVDYYLTHFRELKKPEGYPSIPALYGFRKQLVLEATKGKIKKHIHGQYVHNPDADEWG